VTLFAEIVVGKIRQSLAANLGVLHKAEAF